jgi:hypothetical protein
MARKFRDYQAELNALAERRREVQAKRINQLGELVIATGADALDLDALAGALLTATEAQATPSTMEAWRAKGTRFFQGRRRKTTTVKGAAPGELGSSAENAVSDPAA